VAEISDDAYLLEVMASHAALAFRPDQAKVTCRCKCEERVDALIDAFNQMTQAASIKSREMVKPQVGGAAFGIGVAAGIAASLIVRNRRERRAI
jgi:hypothetical protein